MHSGGKGAVVRHRQGYGVQAGRVSQILKRVRKGFRRRDVKRLLARCGGLNLGEALRCRVRYFSDGVTFGGRDFVEKVFKGARERVGAKRKTGARLLGSVGWGNKQTRLYPMRQLVRERLEQQKMEQRKWVPWRGSLHGKIVRHSAIAAGAVRNPASPSGCYRSGGAAATGDGKNRHPSRQWEKIIRPPIFSSPCLRRKFQPLLLARVDSIPILRDPQP